MPSIWCYSHRIKYEANFTQRRTKFMCYSLLYIVTIFHIEQLSHQVIHTHIHTYTDTYISCIKYKMYYKGLTKILCHCHCHCQVRSKPSSYAILCCILLRYSTFKTDDLCWAFRVFKLRCTPYQLLPGTSYSLCNHPNHHSIYKLTLVFSS